MSLCNNDIVWLFFVTARMCNTIGARNLAVITANTYHLLRGKIFKAKFPSRRD